MKRQDVVRRYLIEQGKSFAKGEIRQALRLTDSQVTTALTRLVEQRKVERIGTNAATRYRARNSSESNGANAAQEPTLQGLIMATIEDRTFASLDELAQASGVPREEVQKACGGLIREELIRMENRDGQPVYIIYRPA